MAAQCSCLVWLAFLVFLMVICLVGGEKTCRPVSFVTYNTALNDIPLSNVAIASRFERRDAIKTEIKRLNADVLCLQEVWFGEDVEYIAECLGDVYKHSFSKLHKGSHLPSQRETMPPPCDGKRISEFIACAMANKCLKRKKKQWPKMHKCLIAKCYGLYCQLSQECISCIVKSAASPEHALRQCVGTGFPSPGQRNMNEPGLILLSKFPMKNSHYTDFHPFTKELIERGYLQTDIVGLGKVVCTHNTMHVPYYFEPDLQLSGMFSSYIEQGDSERAELVDKFRSERQIILMGDFNTGVPVSPTTTPYLPHAFYLLSSAFNVVPSVDCTFCSHRENPYQRISETGGIIVDHVFFNGYDVMQVSRVFTPESAAVLMSGLPLSDHFGVMVVLKVCF